MKELLVLLLAMLMLPAQAAAYSSYTAFVDPVYDVVDIIMNQSSMSLQRLSFYAPGQDGRFQIRVESNFTSEEGVYERFFISEAGLDSEPSETVMDLSLPREWVEDNNVDLKTVYLYIYDGGWLRLDTILTSEDSDYFKFRAQSPSLTGNFALTGTPVPVKFTVTSECNANGVCDADQGETGENCMDCLSRSPFTKCVPYELTCVGNNTVMTCNENGTDYTLEACDFGCSEGECTSALDIPTGLFVGSNPLLVALVAVLVSVIAYLGLSLKRTRTLLRNSESVKSY